MVTTGDLSHHWGIDPSAVSQLRRRRKMPEFSTLAEADAWRAANVKPRAQRSNSSAGKIANTNNNNASKPAPRDVLGGGEPDGEDFATWLCGAAEAAAKLAAARLSAAMSSGSDVEAAGALKVFAEAAGRCRQVREDALRLGERERSLIHVDRAKDIVGVQLVHLRNLLLRLGDRLAVDANPADPALAKRIIDAGVDKVFAAFSYAQQAVADNLGRQSSCPDGSPANTNTTRGDIAHEEPSSEES